jgi:hypothetical protein
VSTKKNYAWQAICPRCKQIAAEGKKANGQWVGPACGNCGNLIVWAYTSEGDQLFNPRFECSSCGASHDTLTCPHCKTEVTTKCVVNKSCFVITATMGDADHPTVTLLRSFRDECLLCTQFGRRMITSYYWFGPPIAALIQRSVLLKRFMYAFVVVPATCFARAALRRLARRKEKNIKPSFSNG